MTAVVIGGGRTGKTQHMLMSFYINPAVRSLLILRAGGCKDRVYKATLYGVSASSTQKFGAFNGHTPSSADQR